MKRMACNNFRWKAAYYSKDWRIRRRHFTTDMIRNIATMRHLVNLLEKDEEELLDLQ
jgi:hypothetical protein